ncbi:MAG: HlyD family efflux transporter periplasmic adaptor subunit [Acidobacteriota bacterium]
MKQLAWIVAAVGLLWLVGSFLVSGDDRVWAVVERGDLVVGIEVEGTLRAARSDLVGPPSLQGLSSFKIASLLPEGQSVQAGTPVIRFDTSELQRELQEKMAVREAADKELEKLRTNLASERRTTELSQAEAAGRLRRAQLKVDVPADLVGADELETARIDLDLAEKEVAHFAERLDLMKRQQGAQIASWRERRDRAAARVAEVRGQIESMTVRAPRDGTFLHRANVRGEKKRAGDSVWRREKIGEIPDLSRMMADGEVDEAEAGRLAVGQAVNLRLDAHPDRLYRGRLVRIAESVRQKSRGNPLKVVGLEIELSETDPARMRPGMRFRGAIELERAEGVLLAPEEAVIGTAEGAVAWRKGLWGVEEVQPTLGRRNGEEVEILAGLEAGDRLALGGSP